MWRPSPIGGGSEVNACSRPHGVAGYLRTGSCAAGAYPPDHQVRISLDFVKRLREWLLCRAVTTTVVTCPMALIIHT